MKEYKEVAGIVQQKVIDKSSEEFNTYIPRNGQLVVVTETVNDDTSASIYVGDGVNVVKDCKTISGGDGDLSEYVKKTDVCSEADLGVCKVNPNYGTKTYSGNKGLIGLRQATENGINNKAAEGGQGYGPITSNNYDLLPFPIILLNQTFDPTQPELEPPIINYPIGTMAITEYFNDEIWQRALVVYMGMGAEGAGPQIAIIKEVPIDDPTSEE